MVGWGRGQLKLLIVSFWVKLDLVYYGRVFTKYLHQIKVTEVFLIAFSLFCALFKTLFDKSYYVESELL